MKQITLLLTLLVVLAIGVDAQTISKLTGGSSVLTYTTAIDSVDSVYSKHFTLSGYDKESFYSYPILSGTKNTSVLGLPKVTVILQGSFDQSNYTNADTLCTNDSTEAMVNTSLTLNGLKFPYYRFLVAGMSGNRSDTQTKITIYLYKRD